MPKESYLQWLASSTKTEWWCDSGLPADISSALAHGAVGVTTNPPLSAVVLTASVPEWREKVAAILASGVEPSERAQRFVELIVSEGARKISPIFKSSKQAQGYICAQVDPTKAGDRESMRSMSHRFAGIGPNVSVKLPATKAGLDILEELSAEGIPVTGTLSFTLPQILAVAEAHERGIRRALARGIDPAPCNAVLMIGRIDDYLAEVAADNAAAASPDDIRHAGTAIAKRAYSIFKEKKYSSKILVAALRGTYHATELAGGDLIISIHPKYQKPLIEVETVKLRKIDDPVETGIIERLRTMEEFVRAYEPKGLSPDEFISYGVTQRTLSQFTETGWKLLETFR